MHLPFSSFGSMSDFKDLCYDQHWFDETREVTKPMRKETEEEMKLEDPLVTSKDVGKLVPQA